jgi:hypothetical protein
MCIVRKPLFLKLIDDGDLAGGKESKKMLAFCIAL